MSVPFVENQSIACGGSDMMPFEKCPVCGGELAEKVQETMCLHPYRVSQEWSLLGNNSMVA
jgi:hypothetical protein